MRTQEYYDETFRRIFPNDPGMREKLQRIGSRLLEVVFDNEEATYEDVLRFLEQYKEDILNSSLRDEMLINRLLSEKNVIDKTKRNEITREYLEDLIERIKNKQFDSKSTPFYLTVLNLYNLYASLYEEDVIREILENDIGMIVNNNIFMNNSNKITGLKEKRALTNQLLSWNRRFKNPILREIFHLERLKEGIITLYNSIQVGKNEEYERKLRELLQTCNRAIYLRDHNEIPSKQEIDQINVLFDEYERLNKQILQDAIENEEVLLVHFVRNNNVDFELTGKTVVNFSDSEENVFDKTQIDFFIEGFLEYLKNWYQSQKGKEPSFDDPEFVDVVRVGLKIFNNTINYKPLDRLPIKIRETVDFDGFQDVIREESGRLSCSIVPNENFNPHLDRKIGLILKPKSPSAIMTISQGYTSEGDYPNFNRDARPSTRIILDSSLGDSFNEICVDAYQCEVVGVLLLTDDEEMTARAEALAQSYHVGIIRQIEEKDNDRRKWGKK